MPSLLLTDHVVFQSSLSINIPEVTVIGVNPTGCYIIKKDRHLFKHTTLQIENKQSKWYTDELNIRQQP